MGESAGLNTLSLSHGASIAFVRSPAKAPEPPGPDLPGLVFCGGFRSNMSGGKAEYLEAECIQRGQGFLRFDYTGHGQSDGRFEDGTIGHWLGDTLAVLDRLTEGPQILIGSSMGGWIAALAAMARPERIAGLIGIAVAPDFTEELVWDRLSDQQREQLTREGVLLRPSAYDEAPYPFTLRLVEEGREHLILNGPVAIDAPVRLIHGMADADVPWRQSLRLAERITGPDVRLTLVKDGEHRLSRPQDLALLGETVADLSRTVASASAAGGGGGTG